MYAAQGWTHVAQGMTSGPRRGWHLTAPERSKLCDGHSGSMVKIGLNGYASSDERSGAMIVAGDCLCRESG